MERNVVALRVCGLIKFSQSAHERDKVLPLGESCDRVWNVAPLAILTADKPGPPDPVAQVAKPAGTGPHRTDPGKSQQANFLDDEARPDENTAGKGQR